MKKSIAALLFLIATPAWGGSWYYCDPAGAYYPYVRTCPAPWREIPSATDTAPPQLGSDGSGEKLAVLLRDDCVSQAAKAKREADAKKQREERQIAEKTAAVRAQREAVAARQAQLDAEAGYRNVSFEDFALDGKDYSRAGQRVIISGIYVQVGQSDYLVQSPLALAMLREYGKMDEAVPLLIEDASRDARRAFLNCRNNIISAQMGCTATILGQVVMCERTTLVGKSPLPCLAVDHVRDNRQSG